MKLSKPQSPTTFTLSEAADNSPILAALGAMVDCSKKNMEMITPLLPKGLCVHVMPGPVEGDNWSVLVRNGATAAKLRQLIPDFEARLLALTGTHIKMRVKIVGA